VRNVALAGVGANNQSSTGASPRSAHDVQCDSISVTVVAPRVSRRDRFDLVEPITPCDTPRWIVSTRPSTSP
jgi:hypothetical protein